MDFRQALNTVIAELTPQPWDFTDSTGATLTVIPAGMPADPGDAEVMIRITVSHTHAAEAGITTTDLPGLIAALEAGDASSHETTLRDTVTITPETGGTIAMTVTEFDWTTAGRDDATATVRLPEEQRMPLASALRRAMDVARGWED
ncbi:hypothetical protein ACWGLG_16190 [Streptomyces antimycoticus]